MTKVAVLGAGSWGTALGILLASKDINVTIWGRNSKRIAQMKDRRVNAKYLPGCHFPKKLTVTDDLEEAVFQADVVVLAVASHGVGQVARTLAQLKLDNPMIVNTAKGFQVETLQRLSQVIITELPWAKERTVVLSGPSHAEEVAQEQPTAIVAASNSRKAAEYVQDLFMTPKLRVYTNPDLVGVELGGALKNVIALGVGICDGLGLGDNAKAALITRGLAEICRLGVAMGANPLTFAGLTGVGDLVVTCTSQHSRNRKAGIALGKGYPLEQVLEQVGMVVEGVKATQAAYQLAQIHQVEMPVVDQTYGVLFENKPVKEAIGSLMERMRTNEVEGVVMDNQWQEW